VEVVGDDGEGGALRGDHSNADDLRMAVWPITPHAHGGGDSPPRLRPAVWNGREEISLHSGGSVVEASLSSACTNLKSAARPDPTYPLLL
jgi:hypothetical protein